jgi:hypothetical protein
VRIKSLVFSLLFIPAIAAGQGVQVSDTIAVGRYDLGRMWTFENPPVEEFSRYGFTPDSSWFRRLRMSALRVPGCSASFVSADGLMVTNHHCARGSISAVTRPGETLLDSGFVARTLEEERRIPSYYADQLIALEDITEQVNAAVDAASDAAQRDAARRRITMEAQQRLRSRHSAAGDSIVVQIVPLYSGGRTSAYVFRRYTDIRLVVAPELLMGFFGGDWDNFTYPRYSLDFAVMRAWDGNAPVKTENFFRWGSDGVREGDPIFIVGNPGQTSRLTTVRQLEYQRNLVAPVQLAFLDSRLEAMEEYRRAHPAEAEAYGIRNRMFSLSNTRKSLRGRLDALRDPSVMGRRERLERMLLDSVAARPAMQARYGNLFREIAQLQERRMSEVMPYQAFTWLFQPTAGSATLQRAFWAWRAANASPDSAAVFADRMLRVAMPPAALEMRYLALQLADIARAYGDDSPVSRAALVGRTAEAAAARYLAESALRDSAALRRAAAGELASDPLMQMMSVVGPRIVALQQTMGELAARESELAALVGRARYEVYGAAIPPDGSSSLRVADGVVRGYEYNGTWAAPFTTLFGVYDRFHANGPGTDWDLPYRWRTAPPGLDLSTPLNFVSTADTYGGNSGSPVVTTDLRIVGLNFDRNVNALVRDYLYLPERGRNVMVDVRAVHESLQHVYGARHVVRELVAGRR